MADTAYVLWPLASYAFIGGGFWLIAAAWRVLYEAARAGQVATTDRPTHVSRRAR